MTKCNKFLNFFDYLLENCSTKVEIPTEVQDFYEMLKATNLTNDKPLFTETGLEILEYLQSVNAKNLKAKDIAEGMGISSKKVSGAIRKLITDEYVERFGSSPVIYNLTDKGKNFDIKNYKENE